MKTLLIFPITVLLFFSLFNTVGMINDATYNMSVGNTTGVINSTETTVGGSTSSFGIGETVGLIAMIVGVIAVGTAVGIKALGSGLDSNSINLIIKGAFYLAFWGVLTGLAGGLLIAISLFGGFIYFILTAMFVLGFMQTLGESGGD